MDQSEDTQVTDTQVMEDDIMEAFEFNSSQDLQIDCQDSPNVEILDDSQNVQQTDSDISRPGNSLDDSVVLIPCDDPNNPSEEQSSSESNKTGIKDVKVESIKTNSGDELTVSKECDTDRLIISDVKVSEAVSDIIKSKDSNTSPVQEYSSAKNIESQRGSTELVDYLLGKTILSEKQNEPECSQSMKQPNKEDDSVDEQKKTKLRKEERGVKQNTDPGETAQSRDAGACEDNATGSLELLPKASDIKISGEVMAKLRKISQKCKTVQKSSEATELGDTEKAAQNNDSSSSDVIIISDTQPVCETEYSVISTGKESEVGLEESRDKNETQENSDSSKEKSSNLNVNIVSNVTDESLSKNVGPIKNATDSQGKDTEDDCDDSQALIIDTQAVDDSQIVSVDDSQIVSDSEDCRNIPQKDSQEYEDSQRIDDSSYSCETLKSVDNSRSFDVASSLFGKKESSNARIHSRILTYDRSAFGATKDKKTLDNLSEDTSLKSDIISKVHRAELDKGIIEGNADKIATPEKERESALLDNTGDESLTNFQTTENDDLLLDDSQALVIDTQVDNDVDNQGNNTEKEETNVQTTLSKDSNILTSSVTIISRQLRESIDKNTKQDGNEQSLKIHKDISSSLVEDNEQSLVNQVKSQSEHISGEDSEMMEDSQQLIIDTQKVDSLCSSGTSHIEKPDNVNTARTKDKTGGKVNTSENVNPVGSVAHVNIGDDDSCLMEDSQQLFIDTQATDSSEKHDREDENVKQISYLKTAELSENESIDKPTSVANQEKSINDEHVDKPQVLGQVIIVEPKEMVKEKDSPGELIINQQDEKSTDFNKSKEKAGVELGINDDVMKYDTVDVRSITPSNEQQPTENSNIQKKDDKSVASTKTVAKARKKTISGASYDEVKLPDDLNSRYAQSLLRIVDPRMYTIKPGERQLTVESFDETIATNSFVCWNSVFQSEAAIYHCPASSACKHESFSYTQLITHLLKYHVSFGLTFALTSTNLAVGHCGRKYECKKCNFLCTYSVQMLEHLRLHFINKPYRCLEPGCENVTFDDNNLKRHIQSHATYPNIEILYNEHFHKFIWNHRLICSSCDIVKAFYNVSTYIYHMLEHTSFDVTFSTLLRNSVTYEKELYNCGTCTYSTRIADAFFEHVRGHVTNGEPMYECIACKNAYVSIHSFKAHQTSLHSGKAPVLKVALHSHQRVEETYRMLHDVRSQSPPKTFVQESSLSAIAGSIPSTMNTGTSYSGGMHGQQERAEIITNLMRKSVTDVANDDEMPDVICQPVVKGPKQHMPRVDMGGNKGALTDYSVENPPLDSHARRPSIRILSPTVSDTDEDLLTYLECRQHNFVSTDYSKYILHLRKYHENFAFVNHKASRGGNNTIAFKEGNYICSGCDIKTTVREVFQEHMRCHTLTYPYQCLTCKKHVKDIWSEHSPCWDKGEEHVRMSIKPSSTMEAVMHKLGPNAPATVSRPSIPPQTAPLKSAPKKLSDVLSMLSAKVQDKQPTSDDPNARKDQIITLDDDDSGDELEIVDPDKGKTGKNTEDDNSNKLSSHGSRKQKTPRPVIADRSPRAVNLAQALPSNELHEIPGTILENVNRESDNNQQQSDKAMKQPVVHNLDSQTTAASHVGPVASSTPARTAGAMNTASSPIQKSRETDDAQAKSSVDQSVKNRTNVSGGNTASDRASSRKRILSYYCMNGYFHCESCKFKLKITQEESFKYHLYIDLHASSQQKKPCVKCGKIGFAGGKDLDCPIVDQIMGELLQQKSQQLSPTPGAQVNTPSSSQGSPLPQHMGMTPPILSGSPQPVQQGGTQLLCGLVNGKLIPLGSLQMSGGTRSSDASLISTTNTQQKTPDMELDKSTSTSTTLSGLGLGNLPKGIVSMSGKLEKGVTSSVNQQTTETVREAASSLDKSKTGKDMNVFERMKDRLISGFDEGISIEEEYLKENPIAEFGKDVKLDQVNSNKKDGKGGKITHTVKDESASKMTEATSASESKELSRVNSMVSGVKADMNVRSSLNVKPDILEDKTGVKRSAESPNTGSDVSQKKAKYDKTDEKLEKVKDISNNQPDLNASNIQEDLKRKLDVKSVDQDNKTDPKKAKDSNVVEIGDSSSEDDIDDVENKEQKEIVKQKTVLKCDIINGNYVCLSCNFTTINGKKFKQHLWKHVHKKSTRCEHLGPDVYDKMSKCPIIIALIQFLVKKINGNQLEPQEKTVFEKKLVDFSTEENEQGNDVKVVSVQEPGPIEIETDEETGSRMQQNNDSSQTELGESERKLSVEVDQKSTAGSDQRSEVDEEMDEGSGTDHVEGAMDSEHDDTDEVIEFQKLMPSDPIYRCAVGTCRFSHDDKNQFLYHLETRHSSEHRLRCRCCKNQLYYSGNDLCLHLERRDREIRKFGCVLCGFTASQIENFEVHVQREHPNKKAYYCSYCETPFPTIAGLIAHLNMSVKKAFKCPYCDKNAPTRKNVLLHLPRGHVGMARKAVESTMVYCENKERPGHRIIGKKPSVSPRKMGVMHGDPAGGGEVVSGTDHVEETSAENQHSNMPPPSNISLSGSTDHQNINRQDSGFEGVGSIMECQYCKFVAFSKSQLEHHELWHEESNSVDLKSFRCSICPCTVEQVADFKFHLQFHPGDHKLKYYKCAGCSYKCSSEDGMEKHHIAVHKGDKGDSSDDDDATYMVAKLKVAFHNGKFMCPKENCTEAYTNVVELQEHSVQTHGNPLSDDHRHDFYKAKTDTNNSNGNGFGISIQESTKYTSDNQDGNADKKNEAKRDGSGSNVKGSTSYGGRKHEDNSDFVTDVNEDVIEPISMSGDLNKEQAEELSDNEDFIQGDISQFNIENESSRLSGVDDSLGDISSITKYHCEMCDYGANDYSALQNHMKMAHPENSLNEAGYNVDSAVEASTEENVIIVQPEEVPSEMSEESRTPSTRDEDLRVTVRAFAPPRSPSLRKCTVCPYATIYRKSYKKHMETHEKFKTFTGNAFKCAYCAFISQAKSPTMKHIKTFHVGKPSKMFYIRLVNGSTMSEMEMMFEFGASSKKSTDHASRERKFSVGSSSSGISSMPETLYNGNKSIEYREPEEDQSLYEFEATLPQKIVFESLIKCPKCPFESLMREELIQHLRTHLFSRNSIEDETELPDMEDDLDSSLRAPGKKIKSETGEIPSHQDPDWFMELTKEEAAFCNKVTGLMLYQCKLCMYMDQSSSQVRVHYVETHPDELPILCGHCRERSDEDTFRQHHRDCHPLHPVKMIKLVLPSQRGKKHLDLAPGELELEEVLTETGGLNDWTEAMRPFVSAKNSGTYGCNFCGYSQYGTSALKRHVFPIHFKHYPYECAYCQIGMTQVNQMKSHIQKMHPSLPIRIRKPLPPNPTEEEIEKASSKSSSTSKEPSPRTHHNSTPTRTYSPSSGRGASPATSTSTISKHDRDSMLSPSQIKQEVDETYNPLNTREGISKTSTPSSSGFVEPLSVPRYPVEGSNRSGGVAVRSYKKVFKCHYCNHTSKWTARDVQRHILTTHLGLKLFNCCYCDFGCYSRNRLEGHVFTEHPQKPFRVANLDKRMNSVQVVQETEDGVDILALHKPDGEPVWALDPSNRDSLRKYTLSGKYVATTTRAPNKSYQKNTQEDSPMDTSQTVAMPVIHQEPSKNLSFSPFADDDGEDSGDGQNDGSSQDSDDKPANRYMLKKLLLQSGEDRDLTPHQMGQMMRKSVPKNLKVTSTTWKCRLCGLTLLRCDRIKYHIICHHWKMRPYKCIHCNVMKYQREPIMQHSSESHPGQVPGAVSVCEEKADALANVMEKIENESPSIALEMQHNSTMDKQYVDPDQPIGVLKKPGMPRPKVGGFLNSAEESADSSLLDENSSESNGSLKINETEELYKCTRCDGCIGDLSVTRDHILSAHLNLKLYTCDFCDASRNDIESMIQHIQKIHPDKPQRFSHAYGKYKDEIEACLSKAVAKNDFKNEISSVDIQVDDNQYKCCRCANFSGGIEGARDHVIKVHFRHRLYTCDFCDVARNDIESIIQHIKKIHPNNPLSFTHAYDKFKQEIDASVKPVAIGKPPGKDDCPACGKSCKNQADLDWHLAEDHPEFVKYQCGYCSNISDNKYDLKEHMVDEHQEKRPDYTFIRNLPPSMLKSSPSPNQPPKQARIPPKVIKICKLCGFATDCLANLNHHMESEHLSLVLFKCRLCSALHKSKDDLLTHYGILHQNDPLQYKVVSLGAEDDEDGHRHNRTSPKGMGNASSLKTKLPTGTKPTARKSTTQGATVFPKIKSPPPNTASPSNSNNYDNRRIVIRYECKHCNYTTKECVTIRRHVMTHVNYKPYSCPLCNLSSIRSNCIKTHIKLHHKDFTSHPKYTKDPHLETMVQQSIIKILGNRSGTIEEIPMSSSEMQVQQSGDVAENTSMEDSYNDVNPASFSSTDRRSIGSAQSNGSIGEDGENEGGPGVKYSCKLCGYSYHGTSQNIRRHVMVHFNYRKFHCPYCDFTAIQSNNVTQHVQGIHDQEPVKYLTVKYKCAYCEYQSVQSHGITKHIRSVHPGKPNKHETLRDEDLEKKLDEAIIKYGPDASPLEMNRRKKLEKVKIEHGKVKTGSSNRNFTLSGLGRRSQLGVNKPRKLRPDQIVPPKPGQCLYYKCKICNFTENSSSRKCTNIRRHVMSHLNYKRYVCPYCPFGSTTTCMTKAHTARKHIGKRVYWLDKKDPLMEKLMRANIIKVGGKPWTTYNYEDVGSRLKNKNKDSSKHGSNIKVELPTPVSGTGSLKSPMQPIKKVSITSPDKISEITEVAAEDRGFGHYQCKMCKKRLANSSAIKRHVAAHFHYRRYGCPYCELLFTQSTFSINHVRAKHKGCAIYYMDNKDPKMEQKIRRAWVNLSVEEDPTELFTLDGIVRGAGKRKIKKPQRALQDMEVVSAMCNNYDGFVGDDNFEGNETVEFGADPEEDVGFESMNGEIEDTEEGMENGETDNIEIGTITTGDDESVPTIVPVKPLSSGDMKGYRCIQCQYETEHKTSMMRHIMWKIGYKPYQCSECSFQDVLSIGLRKHCMRKHKDCTFNPIITKDPEKEKEVEDMLLKSTIQPLKGSKEEMKGLLDEIDEGGFNAASHLQGTPGYVPKLPHVDFVFVKQEGGTNSCGDEQLPVSKYLEPSPPNRISKGQKTSDEPIPDDVIRRSVNKNKCEICGKVSSSKGYIYNHVIRHGPAKLKCVYCELCFYFPKEAKIHSARKHPDVPLKVKRLWGTSNWDKKTQGIEPADEDSILSPAKMQKTDLSDEISSNPELHDNSDLLEGSTYSLDDQSAEISSFTNEPAGGLDFPVFPQPERTVIPAISEDVVEDPAEIEFEDSVMERTPIKIPKKNPRTGIYSCAYCTYTTKNPNHIKCHVLVHDPPHWRCDHCLKKFMMLYKLRKHSTTVHKGEQLKYTNLVTGENCVGTHINYVNAVLTATPAHYHHDRGVSILPSPKASSRSQHYENENDGSSNTYVTDKTEHDDNMGNDSESGSDSGEISLFCPKCRFNTFSEQELLSHFLMHSNESDDDDLNKIFKCVLCTYVTESADDFNEHHYSHVLNKPYECSRCDYTDYLKADVLKHIKSNHAFDNEVGVKLVRPSSEGEEEWDNVMSRLTAYQHLHPDVELRDFLQLPIELLHAFMVQNGLSEIHQ